MDLDGGDGDGFEGVQDCHTRVRVGSRVDDDAVDLAVGLLDLVDDAALVVRLEDIDLVKTLCGARFLGRSALSGRSCRCHRCPARECRAC